MVNPQSTSWLSRRLTGIASTSPIARVANLSGAFCSTLNDPNAIECGVRVAKARDAAIVARAPASVDPAGEAAVLLRATAIEKDR